MKLLLPILALTTLATSAVVTPAAAEEKKLVGPVVKIQLGTPNSSSATITVKDNKSGAQEKVVVKDEATLDKLKAKKINDGDEVRVKFETTDGVAKSFKRTAGCD